VCVQGNGATASTLIVGSAAAESRTLAVHCIVFHRVLTGLCEQTPGLVNIIMIFYFSNPAHSGPLEGRESLY